MSSEDGATATDGAERKVREHQGSFFKELPLLVVIALLLAMAIKTFFFSAFYIPSSSMEQTLAVGDRVIANKLVYDLRDVRRGEIVVFDGEGSFTSEGELPPPATGLARVREALGGLVGFQSAREKDFIKRVIGLPGDRVACCVDGQVTVQPPGGEPVVLDEPYLFEDDEKRFCASPGPVPAQGDACAPGAEGFLVPDGRLFVMGDHRGSSGDSRIQGTIPVDEVIGRAFVIIWSPSHVGTLPVPDTFQDGRLADPPPLWQSPLPYTVAVVAVLLALLLRRRLRRR